MSTELGKQYPCFGDFKCPRCHKKWQSSKAWADYGQKCKSCSTSVIPSDLRKLFVYICNNCGTKWNWAYEPQGLKCKRCSSSILVRPLDREKRQDREFIKAHKLRELNDVGGDNHIDPNKEHRQDLCEKCQKLERPCRQTIGQNYVTTPNESFFIVNDNKSSFISNNQHKQSTISSYTSSTLASSYNQPIYQQNVTNRSFTSNSGKKYEEHDSTSPNTPASDSWCIIL